MTEIGQVYKALVEFKKTMPKVAKSGINKAFGTGSQYSTLEDVLEVLSGLPHYNLYLDQRNLVDKEVDYPLLLTRVVHIDGSSTDACITPILMDTKNTPMQRFGSADTYARRYALIKIFGIADIDNDGNQLKNTSSNGNSLSPPIKKKEASSSDFSISVDGANLTGIDKDIAECEDQASLKKLMNVTAKKYQDNDDDIKKYPDVINKFSLRKAELLEGATA
tara:strand:+ start:1056 stop:1718 length:663 start_codon:yes stop_codon:yes gene_type:complete